MDVLGLCKAKSHDVAYTAGGMAVVWSGGASWELGEALRACVPTERVAGGEAAVLAAPVEFRTSNITTKPNRETIISKAVKPVLLCDTFA
mmetsp:Transcript_33174/g.55890  ORF Transcript_33174/g.55890 Transcript_33174/m.55890 type:complete len:90 (+) Transcript_33174:3048-3317(+)